MMPESEPQKFFNLKEAARFLEMDSRVFRRYVSIGLFPRGIPSSLNSKVMLWHRTDLEIMEWIYRHHERFKRSEMGENDGE